MKCAPLRSFSISHLFKPDEHNPRQKQSEKLTSISGPRPFRLRTLDRKRLGRRALWFCKTRRRSTLARTSIRRIERTWRAPIDQDQDEGRALPSVEATVVRRARCTCAARRGKVRRGARRLHSVP